MKQQKTYLNLDTNYSIFKKSTKVLSLLFIISTLLLFYSWSVLAENMYWTHSSGNGIGPLMLIPSMVTSSKTLREMVTTGQSTSL